MFALCVRHARSSNQYHTTPGDGLKLQKRRGQGIYQWKTNGGLPCLSPASLTATNEIRPGEWQLCLVSYSCYCLQLSAAEFLFTANTTFSFLFFFFPLTPLWYRLSNNLCFENLEVLWKKFCTLQNIKKNLSRGILIQQSLFQQI